MWEKFGGWALTELCERREPRGGLVLGGSKPSAIPFRRFDAYLWPLQVPEHTWHELTHKYIHIKNKKFKNKKLAPGDYDCGDCMVCCDYMVWLHGGTTWWDYMVCGDYMVWLHGLLWLHVWLHIRVLCVLLGQNNSFNLLRHLVKITQRSVYFVSVHCRQMSGLSPCTVPFWCLKRWVFRLVVFLILAFSHHGLPWNRCRQLVYLWLCLQLWFFFSSPVWPSRTLCASSRMYRNSSESRARAQDQPRLCSWLRTNHHLPQSQ